MDYKSIVDRIYRSYLEVVDLQEELAVLVQTYKLDKEINKEPLVDRFLNRARESGIPVEKIKSPEKYNQEQLCALCSLLTVGYDINEVDEHLSGEEMIANVTAENVPPERRTSKLTGEPVSDEMLSILYRCENGEQVQIEEIEATMEIRTARSCVIHEIPTIERANRDAITQHVLEKILKYGSYTIDKSGKNGYNGYVKQGNRLDIVLGLPASGKSSTIVNDVSQKYHSKLIDCDEAKKLLPEYNRGWGSNAVHKESQMIEQLAFLDTIRQGKNVVLPKVGGDYEKLLKQYIMPAKNAGYKIYVHYVEVNRNVALGRMLNRFLEEGRFLDPKLIDKYDNPEIGNRINSTYERLKESGIIDGYSKWDNNVTKGSKPEMLEQKGYQARSRKMQL